RRNDGIMAIVGNSAARFLSGQPQAPESQLLTMSKLWQVSCRDTNELGHRTIWETSEMNAGVSHIRHELIKRLESAPVSLSLTRALATAILLIACPLLVGLAPAQDSKGLGEESA